jgi:hypothetical protein
LMNISSNMSDDGRQVADIENQSLLVALWKL